MGGAGTDLEANIQQVTRLWAQVEAYLVAYAFQLLGALVILAIGVWIANKVARMVRRLGEKRGFDVTLTRFSANVVKLVIIAMVAVAALNNLGITVTPLIAAIGAAAFGATVALQGVLSNYGAGLSIILTRPFKVGDTIAVKGVDGQVIDISLSATKLRGEDGETITVPNKQIVGEIIANTNTVRHVDIAVRVPLDRSPHPVIDGLAAVLDATPEVAKAPKPLVGINHVIDNGTIIGVRFWVATGQYLPSRYAANKAVLAWLEGAGLREAPKV